MTTSIPAEIDVHLPVAAQPSDESILDVGTTAEDFGYDRVWMPETWGRDAVTILARLADRTTRVGLGTSIIPVFSRSAALIGQTAATLQEAADGRFRLGIGPSGPALIEGWHSSSYERPLRRTREYVEAIRGVCAGEEVEYRGDTVTMQGFRLRFDPPSPPPIDVTGMGPKAVELAGRFADGWHALMVTPAGLRERREDLERGAELGDRDPDSIRTTVVVTCCALGDERRARTLARQHLAFYVGAMGPFYHQALSRQGYAETADRIDEAWSNGDRETAIRAVDDTLLDAVCAAGSPQTVRRQLTSFAELDGVDAVAVSPPRGADADAIAATLEAVAQPSR